VLIVLNTLQQRHIECGDGGGSPVAASNSGSKLSGAGTSAQNLSAAYSAVRGQPDRGVCMRSSGPLLVRRLDVIHTDL
jgi:hypothetical protein